MIKPRVHGPITSPPAQSARRDDAHEGAAPKGEEPESGGRQSDLATAELPNAEMPKSDEVTEPIGRELRRMFESIVADPVPEKFRLLLDHLEAKPGKT